MEADVNRGILAVRRFRFGYLADEALGMNLTSQHVKLVRPGPYKPRSYSPTSEQDRKGSFDLTMKIYPNGNSEWMDGVAIGTEVGVIGPLPLPVKKKIYNPGKHVISIAFGVGITNVLATARNELARAECERFTLMYAVRYGAEAIFAEEIEELKKKYGDMFDVRYFASRELVEGWGHGRVDEKALTECVEGWERQSCRFLVVGTKKMMKEMWGVLGGMGFTQKENNLSRKPFQR